MVTIPMHCVQEEMKFTTLTTCFNISFSLKAKAKSTLCLSVTMVQTTPRAWNWGKVVKIVFVHAAFWETGGQKWAGTNLLPRQSKVETPEPLLLFIITEASAKIKSNIVQPQNHSVIAFVFIMLCFVVTFQCCFSKQYWQNIGCFQISLSPSKITSKAVFTLWNDAISETKDLNFWFRKLHLHRQ